MNANKKKLIKITAISILFISMVNIPPLSFPFIILDRDDCQYSNGDGTFTFSEFTFKGKDFLTGQYLFNAFKESVRNNDSGYVGCDTTLYRIKKKEFYKFWHYGAYFFDEKYRVPYKDWDKISKKRVPLEVPQKYVDF